MSLRGLLVELIVRGWGSRCMRPWHQRIDVLVEMAVGEPGEEITQVGIGFETPFILQDPIRLAKRPQVQPASASR